MTQALMCIDQSAARMTVRCQRCTQLVVSTAQKVQIAAYLPSKAVEFWQIAELANGYTTTPNSMFYGQWMYGRMHLRLQSAFYAAVRLQFTPTTEFGNDF